MEAKIGPELRTNAKRLMFERCETPTKDSKQKLREEYNVFDRRGAYRGEKLTILR